MTGGPSPRPSPAGRRSRCRYRSSAAGKGGRCSCRSPGAGSEGTTWRPSGGGTPSVSLECSSRVEPAGPPASSTDRWVVEPRVAITGSDQRGRQGGSLSRKPRDRLLQQLGIRTAGHDREGIPEKEGHQDGPKEPQPNIGDPPPPTQQPTKDPRRLIPLIVLLPLIVVTHPKILRPPQSPHLMCLSQPGRANVLGPGLCFTLWRPNPNDAGGEDEGTNRRREGARPSPTAREHEGPEGTTGGASPSPTAPLARKKARPGVGVEHEKSD